MKLLFKVRTKAGNFLLICNKYVKQFGQKQNFQEALPVCWKELHVIYFLLPFRDQGPYRKELFISASVVFLPCGKT